MSGKDERLQLWVVVVLGCNPGGHYLIQRECDM